jgi:hypothetical protein
MTHEENEQFERDALLQRYIEGECSPDEQAAIEADPVLRQRAEALQTFDAHLRQAFAVRRTASSSAEPALTPEVLHDIGHLFADSGHAMASLPSLPPVVPLEPVTRPAQVRGQRLHFEAPDITLTLRHEPVTGEDPTWILRGWLERDGDGQTALVLLCPADGIPRRTHADAEGFFRFTDIAEGVYDLRLILQDKELRLRHLRLP